jgi:hypothetical protein
VDRSLDVAPGRQVCLQFRKAKARRKPFSSVVSTPFNIPLSPPSGKSENVGLTSPLPRKVGGFRRVTEILRRRTCSSTVNYCEVSRKLPGKGRETTRSGSFLKQPPAPTSGSSSRFPYWFDRDASMCSPGVVCNGPKIPDWLKKAGQLCDTIPVGVNDGAYFFAFAGSNCRTRASI